jgi:hypothetical protein
MYGLPDNTDLNFLTGARLLQVCVGENEVIANFDLEISIMIASTARVAGRAGLSDSLDSATELGIALFPLLGCAIEGASGTSNGTLQLAWDDGTIVEIFDSFEDFESYTLRNGADLIIV